MKNVSGTASLVGTPTVQVLGEDVALWDVVAIADNTNGPTLTIKATGTANETIRWVATVRTTEVSY